MGWSNKNVDYIKTEEISDIVIVHMDWSNKNVGYIYIEEISE
jgi:hypothetical protein